ncbi:MAG TPA: DMT family transporter [Thermoplasmata archaeon]
MPRPGKNRMLDLSILYALCSLLIYGVTQVVAKSTVKSLDATTMVAVNFLVSIPIYLFLLACAIVFWNEYVQHPEYVLYGLIGASTARGGYYIYLEALEKGAVTMVGSITAAFPAITAILAVTILGERISWVNAVGITTIIVSMVALSFSHGRSSQGSAFSRSALLLSVATLLIWGFGAIFIKLALDGLPLIAYLGLYPLILPPIAFAYLRHKKATRRVFLPKWSVPVIGAVVVAELWQLGYFAETSAISEGSAAIVFPLISAYPIVTIIGARLALDEKLSAPEWALLSAVVLGIILTSVV